MSQLTLNSNSKLTQYSFNKLNIRQRSTDGYLSATDMCKTSGKLLGNYLRNKDTSLFLDELESDMRIRTSELIQILKGGSKEQGTWIHPKVAIHLAQWLSPEFAVQVTNWVYDWMSNTTRNPVQSSRQLTQSELIPKEQESPNTAPDYFAELTRKERLKVNQFAQEVMQGKHSSALEAILTEGLDPLTAPHIELLKQFAQELQHGKTPVKQLPTVLNCSIISTHYKDHTLTLHYFNNQAHIAVIQLTRILNMDFRNQIQQLHRNKQYTLINHQSRTADLLCLTVDQACQWLSKLNMQKLILSKRGYALQAQHTLPAILQEAANRLNRLQQTAQKATPKTTPKRLAPPKATPKPLSRAALIKQLEKIEGDKILIVPHKTIKTALRQSQAVDKQITTLSLAHSKVLQTLLGETA